jgi:hypothetical protein
MYLVEAVDAAMGPLRRRLGDMGDSLVVVGGGGLYNVHVHTDDPGRAVEVAVAAGRPRNIRISSLDAEVARACLAGEARAVRVAERQEAGVRTSLVAVALGEGIASLFRSLGAVVVPAGTSGPPSVGDLLEGMSSVDAEGVLVLPNDPAVRATAEGAVAESVVPARVVVASSVPEGLAAATAVVPQQDLDTNLRRAAEAARGVTSGTVARAERAGAFVGLAGEKVVAGGPELATVAVDVVGACRRDRHEIVTVIAGDGVGDDDVERVVAAIEEAVEGLEVEWHRGGQPAPLLIGLE